MRLRALILCLVLLAATSAQAAKLVIVSSDAGAAYLETAQAMVAEFERRNLPGLEIVRLTVPEFVAAPALAPTLVVALGSEAALALAKMDVHAPVLCALLPRHSFERALQATGRKASSQYSALYLDQPLARQIELIRLALPGAKRIGWLSGPESRDMAHTLASVLKAGGLELVQAGVVHGESIFPALRSVLRDADVLLAVPDPEVYNANSIQNILLASFRARVPLVAFSPAYVRAGALMALYATPTQVGVQAAAMARAVLLGKGLPATPQYLQDFSIAVNEHVARSLGLTIEPQGLAAQLRRREGGP